MGQISTQDYLKNIQAGLTKQLAMNKKALPQGFQQERFILNCITMISDMTRDAKKREALAKVDPATIPLCFMKGAVLGLDFFNGECYAIPYGKEMKFQTDYKGEIKLNKKYSKNPIRDIYAKVVREGDEFYEEVDGGEQNIYFKPIPFNDGEMIGAFAVVKYKDGSMMYETMSKSEIESVRNNFSKAVNSTAWKNTPGEMYKKTVLRRLCKYVDMDFDNIDQVKAFEDGGDADFNKDLSMTIEAGKTVNVFEDPKNGQAALPMNQERPETIRQTRTGKRDPEPVLEKQEVIDQTDFEQFEGQFDIPEDMADELPFR